MPARDSGSPTPAERFAEARAILIDLRKSLEAAKRNPTAIGNEHLVAAAHCRGMFRLAISRLGAEADALRDQDCRMLLPDDDAAGPSPFRAARDAQGTRRGALISAMIGDARLLGSELTKATDEANRMRWLRQKSEIGRPPRVRLKEPKP